MRYMRGEPGQGRFGAGAHRPWDPAAKMLTANVAMTKWKFCHLFAPPKPLYGQGSSFPLSLPFLDFTPWCPPRPVNQTLLWHSLGMGTRYFPLNQLTRPKTLSCLSLQGTTWQSSEEWAVFQAYRPAVHQRAGQRTQSHATGGPEKSMKSRVLNSRTGSFLLASTPSKSFNLHESQFSQL